ncbi:fimbria/pilus periplasmic chaperone [Parasphingopyxis marina]|uniref:Molecular chaperone n=1 Tax=Parasphingopyxis marina TaxID=2761622 RepID=A0A842I232_9SPHN|nr:fimbria/pilus periplasmic chaperone [Parasphingopyxis marina]MBC2778759.1 molecular chaperone [Parasphingopyxis marina]
MLSKFSAAILALFLICAPAAANAARVSPMIVELEPVGSGSVARVELTNQGERNIPYEVRVMRGEIDEVGGLSLTPADDEFLVFPPQTIVQANSQQVFRLQYVGEPELAQSEIYYMSIQQVPVAFEEGVSQVQVVINYNVLVNVVPDGTAPAAVVESIEVTERLPEVEPEDPLAQPDEENQEQQTAQEPAIPQPGLSVRVSNAGTRYFLAGMSDWSIAGTAEDGSEYNRRFTNQELTRVIGVGVVGPGRSRVFFVPTDVPLVQDSVSIEVSP